MSSMRQWVWSDELVTLLEEASGADGASPPLIGYAVDEGVDIGALAKRVVGGDRDDQADSGERASSR